MRKKVILITGAASELGQEVIKALSRTKSNGLLALDSNLLPSDINNLAIYVKGDFVDGLLLERLITEYEFDIVYHLASFTCEKAEFLPEMAHQVNVNATLNLMQLVSQQSDWRSEPIRFIYPSSIAVYGLPDLESKNRKVREQDWNYPKTMYGCNQLYIEYLGSYFTKNYFQLAQKQPTRLDFRCLRLPCLIGQKKSGQWGNYVLELLQAAVQEKFYACEFREDTCIPFITLPDAARALIELSKVNRKSLKRHVYNVSGFSLTAGQASKKISLHFPDTRIHFKPDPKQQVILDSWPSDIDDSAARRDWEWAPSYNAESTFSEYLIPNINSGTGGLLR